MFDNNTFPSNAVLLDALCPIDIDASFGPFVSGCRDNFDFTLAFEEYFFTAAPSLLGLVLAAVRIAVLKGRKDVVRSGSLLTLKLAALSVYTLLQVLSIFFWGFSDLSQPLRQPVLFSSAVSLAAAVGWCTLCWLEHCRSRRPSWLLTAYLSLTLLLDAAILRTLYLSAESYPRTIRIVASVSIAMKFVVVIMEAIEKRNLQRIKDEAAQMQSPEEFAGPFGQLFYWWLNGLIIKGFKTILKLDDLINLTEEMKTDVIDRKFWKVWEQVPKNGKHTLLKVLAKVLKVPFILAIIPRLVLIVFIFCQPLMLETFLQYLKDPVERKNGKVGEAMVGAYALVYFGMAITTGFYWYRNFKCATMIRGILMSAIYTKTTQISITALNNAESVTLMSGDVENLVRGLRQVHEIWAAIIQIGIGTWLLAKQLGPACVGPILVCFISVFIMGMTSGLAKKYQVIWMGAIQKRTGITSSVMGSLKGIKMLGLSKKLTKLVHQLRIDEVKTSSHFRILAVYMSTLAMVPMMLSPVVTFAIFLAVAARNNTSLDTTRMFTSISLLILITQPLFAIFEDIFMFRSSMGCFERIQDFLKKETRIDSRVITTLQPGSVDENPFIEPGELDALNTQVITNELPGSVILEVEHGSFGWKQETPVMQDITVKIAHGSLTMICGPVASGKTTFLKALLGETLAFEGTIQLFTDSIAYCDQTPWLMGISIKNNIAGFSNFNQALYQEVLHACDLNEDISSLPDGDDTMVGSRGVTLSGGQKARVALARALYAQKKLILLDDIFSGLDMHTQSNVFERVLGEHGLARKSKSTVVLVTHAVNLLCYADEIIALGKEGKVVEQGTFNELMQNQDGYVKAVVKEFQEQAKEKKSDEPSDAKAPTQSGPLRSSKKLDVAPTDPKRQSGDWSLYNYFFSRIGTKVTITFLVFEVLSAFFATFPTLWLKWWSDANEKASNQRAGYYVGVYVFLQVAGLISQALLTWSCIDLIARKAGIRFHWVLIKTVMRAPMTFLSKTEVGSLVNRFTQDISLIDRVLALALMCSVSNLFIAIGQAVLISSASAYIAISFPALILAFYLVQKYYLRTSRQLRMLDLEAKTPVYTLFLESLEGLSTIRAFAWQNDMISKNHGILDTAQKPFYLLAVIQKWLTLVLDLMTAVLAVIVVSITVATRETASVGFTGVALTQIMSFTGYLKMFMLFWTQLETGLAAISRIREFGTETPDEHASDDINGELPVGWPAAGKVELKGLTAGYEDKMVLENLEITIESGEKFGICGRTGSGKSSLVLALLRMLETSSGTIEIDGVDITTIPKEDIRSEINVISQEPFFFAGTLRHNLDPYDAASDTDMTEVLVKCQLGELVEGKTLDDEFKPDSLSHGQRQLFCLARALLRKGKIVVLDEATSSVDKDTDEMMQRIIREEMKDRTIIAVAHRLQTILDFDRVAVMENGKIVEVGNPQVLLGKESKFKKLVEAM
ncbi:hypothetical protein TWF694_006630 [Orbilia ellipsospora]|uniref:ABC transporter n=1 Tax=Orbilia ellipsospora TaxID=2528407 RepID=A0AAV9XL50_9PEZI